MHEGIKLQQV